jgi:hypothetical protein
MYLLSPMQWMLVYVSLSEGGRNGAGQVTEIVA